MTKKAQIVELREKGMSYNAIARKIEVTLGYVQLVCKEYRLMKEIRNLKLKVASE